MTKTIESKQCTQCEEVKPLTEFNKDARSKSGLRSYCRSCQAVEKTNLKGSFKLKTWRAADKARRTAKTYGVESTLTIVEVRAILSAERCAYCHAETPENKRTIDHVHAMNDGGANTFENVVMACKTCNSAKSSKPAYDFIMKQRNSDATRLLLATLSERMDVDPIQALRVLEAQQTAYSRKQFYAKHYPEVDAQ